MLAVMMPQNASVPVKAFLTGWSMFMQATMHLTEADKIFIKGLFEDLVMPEADCPEAQALDQALVTYLMHKCGSPSGVGSAIPKEVK